MTEHEYNEALEQVARAFNSTVEDVRFNIDTFLLEWRNSPDPAARAFWRDIDDAEK